MTNRESTAHSEEHSMRRTITKTVGGTLAFLCLASSLVMAQGESQKMVCMQVDGKGNCTAAAGADGKNVTIVGDNIPRYAPMSCTDRGYMIVCESALTK